MQGYSTRFNAVEYPGFHSGTTSWLIGSGEAYRPDKHVVALVERRLAGLKEEGFDNLKPKEKMEFISYEILLHKAGKGEATNVLVAYDVTNSGSFMQALLMRATETLPLFTLVGNQMRPKDMYGLCANEAQLTRKVFKAPYNALQYGSGDATARATALAKTGVDVEVSVIFEALRTVSPRHHAYLMLMRQFSKVWNKAVEDAYRRGEPITHLSIEAIDGAIATIIPYKTLNSNGDHEWKFSIANRKDVRIPMTVIDPVGYGAKINAVPSHMNESVITRHVSKEFTEAGRQVFHTHDEFRIKGTIGDKYLLDESFLRGAIKVWESDALLSYLLQLSSYIKSPVYKAQWKTLVDKAESMIGRRRDSLRKLVEDERISVFL